MPVYLIEDSFHDHNKFNDPITINSSSSCSNDPGSNGANEPGDPITVANPFLDTLSVQNLLSGQDLNNQVDLNQFVSSSINSFINLDSVTQNITATSQETVITNTLSVDTVKTDTISDSGNNVFIQMDSTDINLQATNVLVNGENVVTESNAVANPLTSNLSIGSFDVVGVGFGGLNTLNGISLQLNILEPIVNSNQNKTSNMINVVENKKQPIKAI